MSEDKLMSENKLKKYLGDKYTDNPIINFLLYWSIGNDTCPTPKRVFGKEYNDLSMEEREKLKAIKNEWRKMNDLDCIWLDGDLNADTIFSLWTPLKMCLQCLASNRFKWVGNENIPIKNQKYINEIKSNINAYLPRDDDLVKELYRFAELASTRANVMRLIDSNMQERGDAKLKYYDQMPKTLYECFDGGRFSKNFSGNERVQKWVREEALEMFFIGGEISKDKIKPLIKRMKPYEAEWLNKKTELLEMIKNYNEILEIRQEKLG